MIRNVVVGRLRPGASRDDVDKALAAILALHPDGCLDMRAGLDAGLREGNWSFAITGDFTDAEAYRRYDADEEHNRIRRDLFAPITEDTVRMQFEA